MCACFLPSLHKTQGVASSGWPGLGLGTNSRGSLEGSSASDQGDFIEDDEQQQQQQQRGGGQQRSSGGGMNRGSNGSNGSYGGVRYSTLQCFALRDCWPARARLWPPHTALLPRACVLLMPCNRGSVSSSCSSGGGCMGGALSRRQPGV